MNLRALSAVPLVIAAAFWCCAVPASATVATSPEGAIYTGEIKATAGTTELHGEAFSVSCKTSQITGSISTHGVEVPAGGSISTLDFGECSFPVTVVAGGSLETHATSGGNGTVTSSGAKITIHGPFGINCLYQTSNTDVGTLTGGTTAKLDLDSSLVPRTGDSAFCGSSAVWTGSYTVNTPDTLLLDTKVPDREGHFVTTDTAATKLIGTQTETDKLEWTIDGFDGGMVCDEMSWETLWGEETKKLMTVDEPLFAGCYTTESNEKFKLKMNKCFFWFYVAEKTNENTEQTSSLICVDPIEIEHPKCKITVPAQVFDEGITYTRITLKDRHALTIDFKLRLKRVKTDGKECGGAGDKGWLEGSLIIEAFDQTTEARANITAT
ncbi:MAG TPA: hypothetical protein VFY75_07680 [Solirubrobacterales bacterium]|nr:hypothetical protein [Solirubrobacterales bacterium]